MTNSQILRPSHKRFRRNPHILRQTRRMTAPHTTGDHPHVRMLRMRQRCRIRTLRSLPREHLNRSIIVRRHLMTHRTNQRIPIRHLRQTRKNLADVQPRDICRNRTKRPPILTRCLRLRIKCLQLTGTAPHPEQNHRRVRNSAGRNRSSPLSRQQLRQRQTTRRQHTRSQKFPTTTRPSTEFRLPHHITPRSLKICTTTCSRTPVTDYSANSKLASPLPPNASRPHHVATAPRKIHRFIY